MSAGWQRTALSLLVVGSLSLLVVGSLNKPAWKRAADWALSSLAWAGLAPGCGQRASLLLGLDLSPCPCTLGQGFPLFRPPRSRISPRVLPSSQAEGSAPPASPPPACLHLCFHAPRDCRLLLCKENFEGFEEVFSAACPAPHPVSTAWSLRRTPWVSAPTTLALSWPASCLLHFTRSLSSPPSQLCPVTHSFCLPLRPVLDFR